MTNQPEEPRTGKMDPTDINIEDDSPAFNEEPDFSALLRNSLMDVTEKKSPGKSEDIQEQKEEPEKQDSSVSASPETNKYSAFVKEYVLDEGDIQSDETADLPEEREDAVEAPAEGPEPDGQADGQFNTEFYDDSEDGQYADEYPDAYPDEYSDGYYEEDASQEQYDPHIDDLELPLDYLEAFAEDDKKKKKPGLFSRIKESFKSKKKRGNENQLEFDLPDEDQESEGYEDGYVPEDLPEEEIYSPEDNQVYDQEVNPDAVEDISEQPEGPAEEEQELQDEYPGEYTDEVMESDISGYEDEADSEEQLTEEPLQEVTEDLTDEAPEGQQTFADDFVSEELPEEIEGAGEEENAEDLGELDQIDPADKDLMVAFGLDGSEDKSRAETKAERKESRKAGRKSKGFKLDRPEFIDKSQIKDLREQYKKKATGLLIRLCLCVIIAVGLMIYENIPAISGLFTGTPQQLGGAFNPVLYPVVHAMISLQLMLLCCLCAYEEILKGFKNLFKGTPRPESVTAVLTVIAIIYSIVEPSVVKAGEAPTMFNFVVAIAVVLTLIYSTYNNKREMMNFRVVASKKAKHIVRKLGEDESLGELTVYEDSSETGDVMKIEKTDFIDGFYARLDKPDAPTGSFITFVMSISVALAVVVGIFSAFKGDTAAQVCRNIFISVLAFTPISLFVAFSYPFFRANRSAKKYNSTIIGETSLEEYSNASIISFDDKTVFPSYSVKVQNIRIYNNARIDRVLYYAASVFAYAGGPLQDVFELATKDMGNSQDVKIFEADRGYLATRVDGVNIIFGNDETLLDRGFDIPTSASDDDVDFSDELSVMYMFRESKLVAKMYIKYVMDPDIDLILKQLSGDGLRVCVRTFDPNIDEEMIWKKLNNKHMPLQIMRYADADEVENFEEKADSGLVTNGSPKFLLQVISFCGRVLQARKTNVALCTLSILIAIAIMVLMLLTGALNGMNSLLIALYHLVWLIPIYISARIHVK